MHDTVASTPIDGSCLGTIVNADIGYSNHSGHGELYITPYELESGEASVDDSLLCEGFELN